MKAQIITPTNLIFTRGDGRRGMHAGKRECMRERSPNVRERVLQLTCTLLRAVRLFGVLESCDATTDGRRDVYDQRVLQRLSESPACTRPLGAGPWVWAEEA